MSFGILSGTTSIGFAGCCAAAPKAAEASAMAATVRARVLGCIFVLLGWVGLRPANVAGVKAIPSLEGGRARIRDLLVLVRLHAGDADRAHAGALDHERDAAL